MSEEGIKNQLGNPTQATNTLRRQPQRKEATNRTVALGNLLGKPRPKKEIDKETNIEKKNGRMKEKEALLTLQRERTRS